MKPVAMKRSLAQRLLQSDIPVAVLILLVLLVLTYGLLFVAPYQGFYFNPTDGTVSEIYQPESFMPDLLVGDIIQSIGQKSFSDYREDKTLNPFRGYSKDETIEILVRRDNKPVSITWTYPGFNRNEFLARFFNIWWLAYIFWFIAMMAQLHMRPKDTKWLLFVASSYLTAMFLMLGSVSSFRVMMSSILLRVVAWLILPVYIHFHWIFPVAFRRVPRWLKFFLYVTCVGAALSELLRLPVPESFYFLAVIVAFGGSILLLLFHYIFQPAYRRELMLLATAAFLALLPAILISTIGSSGQVPDTGPLSLLALPILPGAYFYVLYRRRLGGLELRANRAMSLYVFLVLLGLILLLAVSYSGFIDISGEAILFATVMIALFTTFMSILVYPAFQRFIERRWLGIKLPARNMVEDYSARIVTSAELSELLKLLEGEVFPSLLVRQYAVVQVVDSSARIMLSRDVRQDQVQRDAIMDLIAASSTEPAIPASVNDPALSWVQLVLPLKLGSDLIGAWLLGRRDPDDHYPQAELPVLQSLANQTVIALSNIIQTERLRAMYEANINRYEQERLRLAHDLHDSLLNEMAALLMKTDSNPLPDEFQNSFDGLIARLREIVTGLRPPTLRYGLKSALDELADNLTERSRSEVQVISDVTAVDGHRYSEIVEHNLYRIVQESCENALKYAHARSIRIHGDLVPGMIDIRVVDDGIGFDNEVGLILEEMVANKHYGLAGMHERANLIGAELSIDSKSTRGTQIHLVWKASIE